MKKVLKKAARRSFDTSKKFVGKNPRLKKILVRRILPYMPTRIKGQDKYALWVANNMLTEEIKTRLKTEMKRLKYQPLISIVTPTYNTDHKFLKECVDSLFAQIYENWELCIVDDASTDEKVREIIRNYADSDKRVKYKFSKSNRHISKTSNLAASMAKGEFIALLDHDDLLWPNALFEVVKALNKDMSLDLIYSDEDKVTEDKNKHVLPFFKPDWNPEFLRSVNYITHFTVVRKKLFDKVGGFRSKCDGAQDWDLLLRITHETDNIHHIPTMLYSWRISENSTAGDTSAKPYVVQAQKKALEDDLKRRNLKGVVRQNKYAKDYWTIDYDITGNPLISIVIPTKDQFKIMKTCVNSILKETTYKNYEIVIVDTGTTDKKMLDWYEDLKRRHPTNIKVIDWVEPKFSYVRSCNEGARQSKGEYLVMLNNDTEVLTPNWLEMMLGYAQQKDIAVVGAKLYYPGKDRIQHAGVGIGLGGFAANSLQSLTEYSLSPQQHLYMYTAHNMSAVTAACMMVRKSKFDEVGGFDEKFRITYNDVDLCLRLLEMGYRNVYLPEVRLIHYESISLGTPEETKKRDTNEFEEAQAMFRETWKEYVAHDPAINPNLSKQNALYDVNPEAAYYK